ncbi:hypothetical protein OA2633_00090 [Oceanicaulis sp. HTCC2633]|uniref:hypothetical protein n=1 Tax=Oceanicaulis sp. HTCC2633 TaxID=314254 RepID=UPI0000669A06|nr:hypothetical protein [Oceanicaulis sp. HTCC2633]EAP89145.1 hypothetical protein OA2633_00090 [Oceanicaulis sp. HTCC2633]
MTQAHPHLETLVEATFTRLRAASQTGKRSRLVSLSGVSESTLREMARPGYRPRLIDNLLKVETALDALDAESAGDGPVADGIGAQAEAPGEAGDIGSGEGACACHGPKVAGTATARDSILAPEIDDQAGQQRGAR